MKIFYWQSHWNYSLFCNIGFYGRPCVVLSNILSVLLSALMYSYSTFETSTMKIQTHTPMKSTSLKRYELLQSGLEGMYLVLPHWSATTVSSISLWADFLWQRMVLQQFTLAGMWTLTVIYSKMIIKLKYSMSKNLFVFQERHVCWHVIFSTWYTIWNIIYFVQCWGIAYPTRNFWYSNHWGWYEDDLHSLPVCCLGFPGTNSITSSITLYIFALWPLILISNYDSST